MLATLEKLTRQQCIEHYSAIWKAKDVPALRQLCLNDLFFLLFIGCNRADMNHDWIFARCREVQNEPNGYLDLWSRGHYKSSIITFGLTIQDILNDPEQTFGIFSFTRPIAKAFLSQIKTEFEINGFLKKLFADILYLDPKKEAPKWSLDDGIIVKRKGNPKESTVEAWGLVDSQPTSRHWNKIIYDDVVTERSVTTPEQILKSTDGWRMSLNLGSDRPDLPPAKRRYAGTTYHMNDTYATVKEVKAAIPRVYPATEDGTFAGKPVLWTKEQFDKKVEEMGTFIAAAQLLLNPMADKAQSFDKEWLRFYDRMVNFDKWNIYITCDAANAKKKTSDYTVFVVLGLAPDNNYYLMHAVRDRMNLPERTNLLFTLVRQWRPIHVGYEEYGLMADIQHIKYVQEQENYRFHIIPLGGPMPKPDRIKRLVPVLQKNRLWLPHRMQFISQDGKIHDFIKEFVDQEYLTFPVCAFDDSLDALSRILDEDMKAEFPKQTTQNPITLPIDSTNKEFAIHEYDPMAQMNQTK